MKRATGAFTRGTMSRREMLVLLAAGVAIVGGAAPATLPALSPPPNDAELAEWLTTQLGDADLSGVAAAWTARHPNEASRARLERALVATRRRGEALAAHLARSVVAEHAAGGAVALDGWYLAPTEARLATLLQLVRSGAR